MAKLCVLLIASFVCLQSSLALKPRVSQGTPVTIKDVPYQAALVDVTGKSKEPFCGGSILSNLWIVTAGHCVSGWKTSDFKVKTGGTQRYEGVEHAVAETIVHPGFKSNQYTNTDDIALIKLKNPLIPSAIQKPIKLNRPSDTPSPGWTLTISGFGKEDAYTEEKTPQLKAVELPVVSLDKCKDDYFLDPITDKMVCAGSKTGASSCHGDSGGPAVANGRLVGIVSSGFLCNTENAPAVFTNVNKYVGWITGYVKNIFG